MKKLIVLVLIASFTGAVIAQQTPQQTSTTKTKPVDKDNKGKKKHHHHNHEHKVTDKK